jgi:hypothetical protein
LISILGFVLGNLGCRLTCLEQVCDIQKISLTLKKKKLFMLSGLIIKVALGYLGIGVQGLIVCLEQICGIEKVNPTLEI